LEPDRSAMLRSLVALRRNLGQPALLPCVVWWAAGCGSTEGVGAVGGPGADGGSHDLLNPAGAGPAAVALGSTSNLAAAGSYGVLAKTGITNVTGSLIAGGDLGVSPAAATFITGFSLIAESTTVFATSASVVAPARLDA